MNHANFAHGLFALISELLAVRRPLQQPAPLVQRVSHPVQHVLAEASRARAAKLAPEDIQDL